MRTSAALLLVAVVGCGSPAPSGPEASPSRPAQASASPSQSAALAPAGTPLDVSALPPAATLDRRWGTYVSEREWGNPREARAGNGWAINGATATGVDYLSGEDGIAALSDDAGEFHIGWAVWDGTAPFVTERLYGLPNPAGAYGETVLDRRTFGLNTPTHSYASYQLDYPRPDLPGNEVTSTTAAPDAQWRIRLEAGKADDRGLALRATVTNRGTTAGTLHLVLKGWFAATGPEGVTARPGGMTLVGSGSVVTIAGGDATSWGASSEKGALDANLRRGGLRGDGPGRIGALDYALAVDPGASTTVAFGAVEASGADAERAAAIGAAADRILAAREAEAATLFVDDVAEHGETYRDALTGLLWSETFYRWDGSGLSSDWEGRVDARDVLIMPDKWEYPWLASWDTGFQAVAAAAIDPDLAAAQLRFVLSDRWQQPDGHVPCAEWVMEVECPPVFGWAALRIAAAYDEASRPGDGDAFLAALYPALVRQYDYWREHESVGGGLYAGGFLGMDNLPRGAVGSAQADGSAWMAAFAGDLAGIATRLGKTDEAAAYAAERSTIADAVNARLWDEASGLYHDLDGDRPRILASYSGLIPLIAGIVPDVRIPRVLAALRDPERFLGPAGVRSVSKEALEYAPGMVGGVNSNWRGPVWLPIDYRIVEALRPIDPALASEIARRTVEAVERDHLATGRFHEYFDGETGAGLGADQQTGWTALVANLIAEEWPTR